MIRVISQQYCRGAKTGSHTICRLAPFLMSGCWHNNEAHRGLGRVNKREGWGGELDEGRRLGQNDFFLKRPINHVVVVM